MRKTFLLLVSLSTLASAQGIVRWIAGGGAGSFCGDGGTARGACIGTPGALAVDIFGNIFIADTQNHRIRKVTLGGVISTVAGNGIAGFSGDGGQATSASLNLPSGVAADAKGRIYILDSGNSRIRLVNANGVISTFAGTGVAGFLGDGGAAALAAINPGAQLGGLALDNKGNLVLTDTGNHRIREINGNGVIFTLAGNGQSGFSGDGNPATLASLNAPNGPVAFDAANNMYFTDTANHRVRMVATSGIISTIAGTGSPGLGGENFPGTNTPLNSPTGMAVSGSTVYVADSGNNRIRRIGATVITMAGGGSATPPADGLVSTNLLLSVPGAIAVDYSGNLVLGDRNKRVFKVLAPTVSIGTAPPGPATATPLQLTFTAESKGDAPDPQSVQVSNTNMAPFSYSATASTVSGGSWLTVAPFLGRLPASLRVNVNPAFLPAGTYQGSITLAVPLATNAPVIAVTFVVTPIPPNLTVTHNSLQFSAISGAGGNLVMPTRILNAGGGGSLNWTASASTLNGGNWLTPAALTGTTPYTLQVFARPNGLKPALYQGSLTIQSGSLIQVIKVNLTVTPPAVLRLGESGVTFSAVKGAGPLAGYDVSVINAGSGTMPWTAAITNASSATWLKLSASSGTAQPAQPSTLTFNADASGLNPGTYHAQVRVASPGAANSPVLATVILNVSGDQTKVPLGMEPGGLLFQAIAGGGISTQTMVATVGAASGVPFTASADALDGDDWIDVSPVSGTIPAGATGVPLTVIVDPSGLTPGGYQGVVNILLPDGIVRSMAIGLQVRPADTTAQRRGAGAACVPNKLIPTQTGLVNNFQTPVAWPAPLHVVVADDCGNAVDNATVVVTFSNGDPPVVLTSIRNGGMYTGTWQPAGSASQITATTTAMLPGLVTGVIKVVGGAGPNAVPQMSPNGAVHGASFAPLAPLSQGSIFSIFGSNLDPSTAAAQALPLPNQLDQVVAALGDTLLPLYYAGGGQVNAQVPYETPAGGAATLVLKSGTQYAVPQTIMISPAQPGIFTQNQSGSGAGVILDAGYKLITPANPVKPGDVVQIYGTGLGATNPPAPTGDKPPTAGLYQVTNPVTATVAGVPANVEFAGVVLGFAGLYQVNVRIPATVPDGALSIVLSQDGIPSNPNVTVQVKK